MKKYNIFVMTLFLTGCSGLVSHPGYYAEPTPGAYHRGQVMATGYRYGHGGPGDDRYRYSLIPAGVTDDCDVAVLMSFGACQYWLPDTRFGVGSAQLPPQMQAPLRRLASRLAGMEGNIGVQVIGHADSSGRADYNHELSTRRAVAVADYLIANGIPRAWIWISGLGETMPVAGNGSPEGRARNRRVEIIVSRQEARRSAAPRGPEAVQQGG